MIASVLERFVFGIIKGGIISEILSLILIVVIFKIKLSKINSFQKNVDLFLNEYFILIYFIYRSVIWKYLRKWIFILLYQKLV